MVSMSTGAFELLRRITTCLILVALAGIYAMPLAAAFASSDMDCCVAGMCPRAGHSMSQHHTLKDMPDCAMGSLAGSMRQCEMGACDTHNDSPIRVGLFVLSAPMHVVRSSVHVPVLTPAPQQAHPVSQVPETPPPQISLS